MAWFARAIRPPVETIPSDQPGDPHGVTFDTTTPPAPPPPPIGMQAWAGWPSGWNMPVGGGYAPTDTAWACIDLNANILASMPPYLVDAADTLDAGWLVNPDPDIYTSWEEFAKQLFFDFQLGETFVLATARYASGWPARFHVIPPFYVQAELDGGRRRYTIGDRDVSTDILHIRYTSRVDDARGHGPLEAGYTAVVASQLFTQYATGLAQSGIPSSLLKTPANLSPEQATALKAQWIAARNSGIGEPAVLAGDIEWQPTQLNPSDMALLDLQRHYDSRIAVMLGVPPFLVGLPSGGDPMTYQNVTAVFDYHWRAGLRPRASAVMGALSGWLLPRGTTIELNRDSYVQPDPYTRAQTAQIYAQIGVLSVDDIRQLERFNDMLGETTPRQLQQQIPPFEPQQAVSNGTGN